MKILLRFYALGVLDKPWSPFSPSPPCLLEPTIEWTTHPHRKRGPYLHGEYKMKDRKSNQSNAEALFIIFHSLS